jgi:hypothetical protein
VLGGRCTLILDGTEHELHAWDFVHCPTGTRHAFVGAGDGPCWSTALPSLSPPQIPTSRTRTVRVPGSPPDRRGRQGQDDLPGPFTVSRPRDLLRLRLMVGAVRRRRQPPDTCVASEVRASTHREPVLQAFRPIASRVRANSD